MDSFEFNKIAAGILVAGLAAIVIGKVGDALYRPDTAVETRGYQIEVADGGTSLIGDARAEEVKEETVDIAALMAAADPEKGKKVLKKCTACHSFDKGGKNKVGPALWDIVDRPKASHEGFSYSDSMAAKGGNWDYDSLFAFLENPKKYVPKTKMAFAGVKKPEDRANLIALLRTFSDNPKPLP